MSRELVCPYRVCDLSLCYVEETLPPEVGVAWDHHHYFVERCLKRFLFTQTRWIPDGWLVHNWSFPSSDHQNTSVYVSIRQYKSVKTNVYLSPRPSPSKKSSSHDPTHYFVLDTHVHICMKLWDTETHSRKWSHQYYSFFIHECVHNDDVVVVMMITSFFKRRVDDSTCDMSDSVTLTETIPSLRKGTVFVLCIIITDKQKIQVVITDNIL